MSETTPEGAIQLDLGVFSGVFSSVFRHFAPCFAPVCFIGFCGTGVRKNGDEVGGFGGELPNDFGIIWLPRGHEEGPTMGMVNSSKWSGWWRQPSTVGIRCLRVRWLMRYRLHAHPALASA